VFVTKNETIHAREAFLTQSLLFKSLQLNMYLALANLPIFRIIRINISTNGLADALTALDAK